MQNLAEELRETERQLSKLDEGRKNNMIAIRDLEMTKERLLSFAEYAKDAQPEVLVTLIQTIVERIYIVDKNDERYCHIFIKGCSGEDYTGFFQTAGYIEQKTTPVCDSEQYCIRSQISTTDYLWEDKDGYRANATKAMRVEGSSNHRSGSTQRSHSYAYIGTTEIQCRADNGISQREKQPNDFREIRKPQVQVWESAFLMPGLLCKYSRSEQEGNSRVYPKSATGRLHRRPNEYKGVCRPVYGSANNRGQINRSPFRGSP